MSQLSDQKKSKREHEFRDRAFNRTTVRANLNMPSYGSYRKDVSIINIEDYEVHAYIYLENTNSPNTTQSSEIRNPKGPLSCNQYRVILNIVLGLIRYLMISENQIVRVIR